MAKDPHHLEAPIQAVIDATNKGDAKAFVAAFSKDAHVNDWGEVHVGRGDIGTWDREENTGAKTKLKVTGVSRLAGEVLVLLQITRGETTETGTWSFRVKGQDVISLEIG
jgi:hypothetical protein